VALLTDQETTTLVGRELQPWLQDLKPLWAEWNRLWKLWNVAKVTATEQKGALSKVQSAYPLYAVEQILPRILGNEPTMSYEPVDDEQDDLAAILLGKIVSYQMKRMGFEYHARDFIRQALVTGYSTAKVGWVQEWMVEEYDTTEQHPAVPEEPDGPTLTFAGRERRDVCTRNEPFVETVNNYDFVWPLYAKSLQDAPAVWQRTWVTMKRLRELEKEGIYGNVDQIVPDADGWVEAYQPQFDVQGLSPKPPTMQDPEDPNARVAVWERWTNTSVMAFANARVNLRNDPHPLGHNRKPFIDYAPIPRPFQLQGLGIIYPIEDSNDALSTLMRQVTDAITYQIAPMFKHTPGIDWTSVVIGPGRGVEVEDTEDVEPLSMPNVDIGAALQWAEAHRNDMERYSGVFEYGSGNFPQAGAHTATGVSSVIQEGMKRIEEMVNVFSYRSMHPFGYMLACMNKHFLDQNLLIDFSDDPKAQQAWQDFADNDQPDTGPLRRAWAAITGTSREQVEPPGRVQVPAAMAKPQGKLDPVPQVGQDKTLSETQHKSDITQTLQAIAPIISLPGAGGVDVKALTDWALKGMGVSKEDRVKILTTPPVQAAQQAAEAIPAGASGPSGPSGDAFPTGGVVGAPGAAGGSGGYGTSQQ